MRNKKKIVTVVGARPQFVKAAVLSRLIRTNKWKDKFNEVLVHTGQHYDKDMSDVFFEEMEIPKPYYNLNIGSGSHGKMTGEMLIKIEEVLLKEKPDFVLVYGDTNSTLAATLAASKMHIKLVHVEAGLRSFWKSMPEEQNRICTDHLSDFLFSPTETAVYNLKNEGLTKGVFNVGDIMFDAYLYYSQKLGDEREALFEKIKEINNINLLKKKEYYLLTIHRAENTDNKAKLKNIVDALNKVKTPAIYPAHPRTIKQLKKFNLKFKPHIHIIEPVGYFEMLGLQTFCKFIVTDSGGLQKEAFFAKKPCITLREQTEWIETVKSGWNKLVGSNCEKIIYQINNITIDENKIINYYGNGDTGEKVLKTLAKVN
jgi:UDP-GlcNAc3NAcA epimerase